MDLGFVYFRPRKRSALQVLGFQCLTFVKSTQNLANSFTINVCCFPLNSHCRLGSLGHKPWSVYGSLECNTVQPLWLWTDLFPSNLSHVYFANGNLFHPRMKENWGHCADDAVRAGITYPGQSDLTRGWWTDGKGWMGKLWKFILRLSLARSRRCSHGHPKSGWLVQQHGLGVLLGSFWTDKMDLWLVDEGREGAL